MWWTKLKNRMFYGGIASDEYEMVYPELMKSNLESLKRFTVIVAAALLIMLAASLFESSLEKNRLVYMGTLVAVLLILLMSHITCKKHPKLILPCVYLFLIVLLVFGILLCTIVEPNEVAVSFVILLFALPLLFTDKPIRMVFLILAGLIIYTVMEEITINLLVNTERAHQISGYNATNVYPYGLLSMVVSPYMMQIKIERYSYMMKSKHLSETDQMTGLLNRRSYSMELEKLKQATPDPSIIVCSIDLNGLKAANDTKGHSAGDELICGAADCIQKVFGPYGTCYRTGGDEFVAILHSNRSCGELRAELQKQCDSWHGTKVDTLSLSAGLLQNTQELDIDTLISLAETEMYAEKTNYYIRHGRRRTDR